MLSREERCWPSVRSAESVVWWAPRLGEAVRRGLGQRPPPPSWLLRRCSGGAPGSPGVVDRAGRGAFGQQVSGLWVTSSHGWAKPRAQPWLVPPASFLDTGSCLWETGDIRVALAYGFTNESCGGRGWRATAGQQTGAGSEEGRLSKAVWQVCHCGGPGSLFCWVLGGSGGWACY